MKVLVIAAHPDDETLGAGATIAKFAKQGHKVRILIFGEGPLAREQVDTASVKRQANNAITTLGAKLIGVLGYPDNQLDKFALLELARKIEKEIENFSPELVLTHHFGDLNQDHRQIANATFIACRPVSNKCAELWCYEVLSSTDWIIAPQDRFNPNLFVKIDEACWKLKMRALNEYKSELRDFPHSRSTEAIEALSRVRGVQAGVARAEAFWLARKVMK